VLHSKLLREDGFEKYRDSIGGKFRMQPIHPGRILKRELNARELSANRLALALRVPSGRITSLLNGKRAVTPDTALRLARYFGNSAQFWLNLQTRYDLLTTEAEFGERIKAEVIVAG
jgi:addiction module HigA family antidote